MGGGLGCRPGGAVEAGLPQCSVRLTRAGSGQLEKEGHGRLSFKNAFYFEIIAGALAGRRNNSARSHTCAP